MNGYRLRVWVGRDGIMFVSCFSVSRRGWLFLCCTILAVSATGLGANPHPKPVPIHTKNCLHTRHNKAKVIR